MNAKMAELKRCFDAAGFATRRQSLPKRTPRTVRPRFFIVVSSSPSTAGAPGASKGKDSRYLDICEADPLDEARLAKWIKQAAALPGWVP